MCNFCLDSLIKQIMNIANFGFEWGKGLMLNCCHYLQDKEGVLYQTEIEQLLKDLNGEAFLQLSKALEMNPETISDNIVSLCQWSCTMGSLARSYLVYHLRRIGRFELAQRLAYQPKQNT